MRARSQRPWIEKECHPYVTGGKVASKEIFHAQHSLGIAVTIVTQLLGDVAPQLQMRIKLTFHSNF